MKTLYPDLFPETLKELAHKNPETLLVSREGDRVFTTSLKVAEYFHKRHTHVLRAIENLLADLGGRPDFGPANEPNFGLIEELGRLNFEAIDGFGQPDFWPANGPSFGGIEDFRRLNFQPATYLDSRGRCKPSYDLSHDGFALVAMRFTGREALAWQVKFLAAFREMERQLHAQKEREANALFQLRPKWQPIILHPELRRQQLIGLTGHKSPGSITACRRRMRDVGLLDA